MDSVFERLDSLVNASQQRLAALSEEEAGQPVKAGGWSRKQILGHLIDSASNNHQRFVRCVLNGGLAGWPSYEQEGWVRVQKYQDAPWAELVGLWFFYNRLLCHVLGRIPSEKLSLRCQIGTSEMSLGEVAQGYVEHMEHHLKQIFP